MCERRPRILVVDDDPAQLEMICRGLYLHGYVGTPARGADCGLELARCGGSSFALALVDLTMRDGNGLALVREIRALAPSLPLLAVTGLADASERAELSALGAPILCKPFTPAELEAAVRATLGQVADASH